MVPMIHSFPRWRWLFVLTWLLTGCGHGPPGHQTPQNPSKTLARIVDGQWRHTLATSLPLRLKLGLPLESLPDLSPEGARRERMVALDALQELEGISPETLGPEERLTLEFLLWKNRDTLEALDFYWLTFPVTPYASPIASTHYAFTSFPFRSRADLGRYLALVEAYPAFLKTIERKLIAQAQRGIVLPRAQLPAARALVNSCLGDSGQTIFVVSGARLAEVPGLSKEERRAFQESIRRLAMERILPRLESLQEALGAEYEAKAPEALSLRQYPQGDAYYRHLVRHHTTLDLSPEEIHALGLAEVSRLEGEMAALRAELGLPQNMEAAHFELRTSAEIRARYPTDPEGLRQRMLELARGVQPRLKDFFLRLPEAPFDVRRLDPTLEGSLTFGYYQDPTPADPVGVYYFNGSELEERPMFFLEALVYHELEPGHHLQLNLASEDQELIPLRRELQLSAYIEGWGEYASSLGWQLGGYDDPYDRYGRLLMDMLVSVRLVVDTGIHRLGWTQEQAFDFMRPRLLDTDEQIQSEILRYGADIPGQALAYKIGARKLAELRATAEAALGEDFDIRQFHQEVLQGGALPLTVLEGHLKRWLAQAKSEQDGR